MLTEGSLIDVVEVLADGRVQVRRANLVLRDGVEIARTFHRHVLMPGDDLAQEHPRVAAIAQAAWTAGPAVVEGRDPHV